MEDGDGEVDDNDGWYWCRGDMDDRGRDMSVEDSSMRVVEMATREERGVREGDMSNGDHDGDADDGKDVR